MKTRQVLKLIEHGKHYTVAYLDGEENPYRVYEHTAGYELDGRYHERKKTVAKYADLTNCLYWLAQRGL